MKLLALLLALLGLAAAGHARPARAEPLKVVASFSIIADFARNVGGGNIALTTLIGADGDPHVYAPRPGDAAALARADVVLVNGLNFEGFLTRLVKASATKAAIVQLARGAALIKTAEEPGHAGGRPQHEHADDTDPHAWQTVANAKVYVRNIASAFCGADAKNCAAYMTNAQAYLRELDALDREIRSTLEAITPDRRVVISAHDAFAYFGRAYGIRFLAPEGINTDAEASASGVAALIRQIRANKASALFVENISDPRLIEQIASETGIHVGGALYSDALSAKTGPAATYTDMMRHNARTIARAVSRP